MARLINWLRQKHWICTWPVKWEMSEAISGRGNVITVQIKTCNICNKVKMRRVTS